MVQETWNYSIAIASVYIASVSLCLVPISILMSIYLVPHLSDRKSIFICFSAALVACAGFYDYFVNRRPDVDSLAATRTMDAAVWTSAGLIFLTAINISRGSALSLLTKQVPTKHKILINTINLTLFMIGRGWRKFKILNSLLQPATYTISLLLKQFEIKINVCPNITRGIGCFFGDLFHYDEIGTDYSGRLSPRNVYAILFLLLHFKLQVRFLNFNCFHIISIG